MCSHLEASVFYHSVHFSLTTMVDPGMSSMLSPPESAPSPNPSSVSTTNQSRRLPTPRIHRLRPGSQKEIALINYLDDKILRITRRYAKKFSNENRDGDDTPGYTSYDQFVADVDPLIDVVWISGTRKSTASFSHSCNIASNPGPAVTELAPGNESTALEKCRRGIF